LLTQFVRSSSLVLKGIDGKLKGVFGVPPDDAGGFRNSCLRRGTARNLECLLQQRAQFSRNLDGTSPPGERRRNWHMDPPPTNRQGPYERRVVCEQAVASVGSKALDALLRWNGNAKILSIA